MFYSNTMTNCRAKLDCWWHLMDLLGSNLPHHAAEIVQVRGPKI